MGVDLAVAATAKIRCGAKPIVTTQLPFTRRPVHISLSGVPLLWTISIQIGVRLRVYNYLKVPRRREEAGETPELREPMD